MVPTRIIWHHSADSYTGTQFSKINAYHKSRGFSISALGYFVGYHWVIEQNGDLEQARIESELGQHDADENFDSIGICLAGNFNNSYPTLAQEKAAADLVAELVGRWSIPVSRFEPHRFGDSTDCPGKLLPDNWLLLIYIKHRFGPVGQLIYWLVQKMRIA